MRELFTRFLDLFRRGKLDGELKDEISFHKQMLERDAIASGANPDDAAYAAHRQLGNITGVRERARDAWSFAWVETLMQDLRYAFRGLRRAPGFTAAAVITLGLGIGANAAMFGVIDRLMFRPVDYLKDPASVRRVYFQTNFPRHSTNTVFPYTRYLDFQKMTSSFSEFAGFSLNLAVVGVGDEAREEPTAAVTASFFNFFDAQPVAGRFFSAAEDQPPTGALVAVLSYAYWQSHYGGRDVLGQTIKIRDYDCTIIGIAPPNFTGVAEGPPPSIYFPITTYGANAGPWAATTYYTNYNWDWTQAMVRVKPGVSLTTANADLTNAFIRSRVLARAIHPNFTQVEKGDPHGIAGPLKTANGPDAGLEARTLLWVTGVAVIVLLIACANVANLFLARALRRRREVALRLALGVSKRRLLAQSLTESLLLSFIGCAVGIAIAQWGGTALAKYFIPDSTQFSVVTDWRTLAVAVGAAILAGVLAAFGPVVFAQQEDLAKSLKSGVREGTFVRSRLRSGLLVVQGALSVVLLVGAGLFIKSLGHVQNMHLGFDASKVLQVTYNRRGVTFGDSVEQGEIRRLIAAAQRLPEVEYAAWVSSSVIEGSTTQNLSIRGIDSVSRLGRFDSQTATPDYFAAMQTRILRGRGITSADGPNAPKVLVVSEGMAKRIWPTEDAIGQCITIALPPPVAVGSVPPCAVIVGIAEDAVHNPVADEPYRYYMPLDQYPQFGAGRLLLRMRGDPARATESVRSTLQKEIASLSFLTARPLSDLVDRQRRSWQIGAMMFVAFGLLALIVASVGLYGVIAYNVGQRMHELGVRVALGAQPGNILGLIVGQGMNFALAGVVLGVILALVASRWLQPLLYQQSAKDPIVYVGVAVVLLFVAIAASTAPALRAAKADPNAALRSD